MFDIPQPASPLHLFAHEFNQPIQHAALLLGGRIWLHRAQRLLDDLSGLQPLEARVIREATALLSLLSLDNVHVIDSIEAAFFTQIDPSDPCVEDICLLTEALETALEELAAPIDQWNHCNEECGV